MLLASHIIVSGLLGAATKNYFLAAVFGFASHYILDFIPHWDSYLSPEFNAKVKSQIGFIKERFFWKEMSKAFIDILIGIGLLFILLKNFNNINITGVIISVFFGVLPDPLHLLHSITKWKFIEWNYKLQLFIHRLIGFKKDQSFWPGMITQIATIGIVFLILRNI